MTGVPSLTTARKEQQRLVDNPLVRGFLVFSAFRAVYGTGILVVTYLRLQAKQRRTGRRSCSSLFRWCSHDGSFESEEAMAKPVHVKPAQR